MCKKPREWRLRREDQKEASTFCCHAPDFPLPSPASQLLPAVASPEPSADAPHEHQCAQLKLLSCDKHQFWSATTFGLEEVNDADGALPQHLLQQLRQLRQLEQL